MNLNCINNSNNMFAGFVIALLLIGILVFGGIDVRAKSSSISHHHTSKGTGSTHVDGFTHHPPIGTAVTGNNSADALSIAHKLAVASINASKVKGDPCSPRLDHFILPSKESRFTVIKHCVTVTGRVVWKHYFNDDGDANFNVVLDPPYKNMLGPGSYSQAFANKYPGGPALHIETVCQAPVTSKSKENVGACDGYDGPDFKPALPKIGQRVMVTGRYLIEMPEMPGEITELHPAYGIKILP
jgi:hypothetical protein